MPKITSWLTVIGFFCYFFLKKKLTVDKCFLRIIGSYLLIAIWTFICSTINGTSDFFFVSQVKYNIFDLFAIFSIILIGGTSLDYRQLLITIMLIVVVQCLIAVGNFLLPSFREILYSIQLHSEIEEGMLSSTIEHRLVGFGASFFYAGIINGIAIIIIGFYLSNYSIQLKEMLLIVISFGLILAIGTMMARTTLTGLTLVILFFFRRHIKIFEIRGLIYFFLSFIVFGFLVYVLLLFNPKIFEGFYYVVQWAFEFLFNYLDGSGLETASTNQLKEMYVWPSTLKTFFIGDSYFMDPFDDTSYYMRTDVGYSRLIFFFGIPGLIFYFLPSIVILQELAKLKPNGRVLVLGRVLFLYGLILNFKGLYDISPIILIIYVFYYMKSINVKDANIINCSYSK
ncbi:MAG: hypothetical protein KBH01_00240 [Breznakibacter sp.]|nr:hypothetical protein [Breznakibacter sp.]